MGDDTLSLQASLLVTTSPSPLLFLLLMLSTIRSLDTPSLVLLFLFAYVTLWLARFLANYLLRVSPTPHMNAATALPELPEPEPVPCGELTLEQLRAFDGSDSSKPLYLVSRYGSELP